MDNILILDGMERSALAATRALGRKGGNVFVCDSSPASLAGCSKYCKKYLRTPSIETHPTEFLNNLRYIIKKNNINILLPMSDISTSTVLSTPEITKIVKTPCPSYNTYNDVTNKSSLFRLASTLAIPIPETYFIDHISALDEVIEKLDFPIVIKPSKSRVLADNQWIKTQVQYVESKKELFDAVQRYHWLKYFPFMLQEYICGQGQGTFAFYDNGQPVTFFSHKRLREKPPSGGVSVLCESAEIDPVMLDISKKLLGTVGWHGAAMIEFKVSPDGTPYLMEINGRFWGSLQLSIDSGIDFPYLAFLLAQRQPMPAIPPYKTGIRSRWLLGDLDHLYLRLKQPMKNRSLIDKLTDIYEFLKLYQRNTRYEINRIDDPKPFLFELQRYTRSTLHT